MRLQARLLADALANRHAGDDEAEGSPILENFDARYRTPEETERISQLAMALLFTARQHFISVSTAA